MSRYFKKMRVGEFEELFTGKILKSMLKELSPVDAQVVADQAPRNIKELERAFEAAKRNFHGGILDAIGAQGKISKDLAKVVEDFPTENLHLDGIPLFDGGLGFRELDNGFSFLGACCGNDWEFPVFVVIYFDGKDLRGYVPKRGNSWNWHKNTPFMHESDEDHEADLAFLQGRYPGEEINEDNMQDYLDKVVNVYEMLEDIKERIKER